jgi:hypothetical protein
VTTSTMKAGIIPRDVDGRERARLGGSMVAHRRVYPYAQTLQ